MEEKPNGVAEAVWRWYDNAGVARTSYATPAWSSGEVGCSTFMIGPNLLLTAAHCIWDYGSDTINIRFQTYGADSSTAAVVENFTCKQLYNTWHSSDLALFYCPPNGAGINPGDKYGYLDLDPSSLSVGDEVYSVWANSVDTPLPRVGDVRLVSFGQVTSTTHANSFTTDPAEVDINPSTGLPDWTTSYERPIGIVTNVWGNYGASGSAQLRSSTHKVVIGPMSKTAVDAVGRYALALKQYMLDGTVDTRDPKTTKPANITALGLTPSNYAGLIDENQNGLIDLQEDLERQRGEAARGWYALEFDSPRRNALWDTSTVFAASATFNPQAPSAHLSTMFNHVGVVPIMVHNRLNLPPGTYRLSVKLKSTSASDANALWFGFKWETPAGHTQSAGRFLPTPQNSDWTYHTLDAVISYNATNARLVFESDDILEADIASVNIAHFGEVMNMDTADKRLYWRNNSGGQGRVVPRGWNSTTEPNWALRVKSSVFLPFSWPMENRSLGLVTGNRYRICFDARSESTSPAGAMRVRHGTQDVTSITFSPTTNWVWQCSNNFKVPADGVAVQFGFASGNGSYLVDNIYIEPQPDFVIEPGTDRPGSDISNFDLAAANPLLCEDACANTSGCVAYTYVEPGHQSANARCWLKSALPGPVSVSWCQTGYIDP